MEEHVWTVSVNMIVFALMVSMENIARSTLMNALLNLALTGLLATNMLIHIRALALLDFRESIVKPMMTIAPKAVA